MTLTGMEHTLRQLKRAPDVVKKKADDVVGLNAALVAAKARQLAPFRTGELRNGIDFDHKDGSLNAGAGIESGSPALRYWYFNEMGTVNMAARPFFRPAAEERRNGFIQDMRDIGPEVEREMEQ